MTARIRQATPRDAPAIARVHVASWRTTYRGLIPDAVLDNLSEAGREAMWSRALTMPRPDAACFVAETAPGEIVGFADGGPEREGDPVFRGELYAIYLVAAAQGHGIGRALAGAVARHLSLAGYMGLLVWVLEGNPACGFYAALGGVPVRTKPITLGGAGLTEIAYGWTELAPLLADAPPVAE